MIDPDSGTPYIPTLYYFLGAFDIYDREETLGEELSQYDPNNPSDRAKLVKNYCLPRYKNHSYKKNIYFSHAWKVRYQITNIISKVYSRIILRNAIHCRVTGMRWKTPGLSLKTYIEY